MLNSRIHRFHGPLLFVLLLLTGAGNAQSQEDKSQLAREEAEDYFKKWLNQDVLYLITDEERSVFDKLATSEEKEQFIEQFWFRRDPDPKTAINEFKEEHYRRLAYVNEKFSVGMPGWMSDRGRIYIIHGPPAQIESHPTGGQYQRPLREGGGWTQAYPWERWRYHYIEGIGQDVELEFVDRSLTGQYKLALNPEEKDALLEMGKAGPTIFEIWKTESKGDRPYLDPRNREAWNYLQRQKDMPFERYLTYSKVQATQPIKYTDLQELVKINVTYDKVPFDLRLDYFRLNDAQVLVPITVELQDKDLSFKEQEGVMLSDVAVYGLITSMTNRIVQEFDDELASGYRLGEGQTPGTGRSMYQKVVVLENPMRYKLDLVIKDLNSGNVGVVRKAISPPNFSPEQLGLSSVILSNHIYLLDEFPDDNAMFVIGDVKIRPSLDHVFSSESPLGVYFQTYYASLDQTTLSPSVKVTCRITHDGQTVMELIDEDGEAVQYFTSERMVLIQELPITGLRAGNYHLEIQVEDRIASKTASAETDFMIATDSQASGASGG